MVRQTTLEYNGKPYELELDQGQTSDSSAGLPGVRPMWRVTLAGTAITSFEGARDDTDAAAQDRLRAWLDQQPNLTNRDQIHLGGG